MHNSTMINADYLHKLFCETFEIEQYPDDSFYIFSYDDIDFFNKLSNENIEIVNKELPSILKQFEDGHIEMYVNETTLFFNQYYSIEIILTQIFNIYVFNIERHKETKMMVDRLSFLKNVEMGFNNWIEYCSIYSSVKISQFLHKYYEDESMDFYSKESSIEVSINLINEIIKKDDSKESKISSLMYALSKLASVEELIDDEKISYFNSKKLKIFDISKKIEGKVGIDIQLLYKTLVSMQKSNPNIFSIIKLEKLLNKIIK